MRISLVVMCLTVWAGSASAQSLKAATYTFAVTAAADWTMTGVGLSKGAMTEGNPSLRWAHDNPVAVVAAGAAMDVAGVWTLHKWVAPKHPKIAAIVLYAQAATRVYFASKGVRMMR